MIATLPAAGRFIVETETDTYDVDVDARIAVWHDMATEGTGVHVDPDVFLFDTVDCRAGLPMLFDDDGEWRRVTPPVVGIVSAGVVTA